jgi:predicted nucleic acid-binding protein
MSQICVDSNVLLRLVTKNNPGYTEALSALIALRQRGDSLCVTSQVIFEFWSVCTRPTTARGGYGLAPSDVEALVGRIEKHFTLLEDTPGVYTLWRSTAIAIGISGVQVHDAHLASSLSLHNVAELLTYNGRDFARYSWINAIHPSSV